MSTKEAVIQKGVPIPEKRRRGHPRKHPIDKMEVGDYMRIRSHYNSVYICVMRFIRCHQPKWEYQLEKISDRVTDVWRVK